MAAILRKAANAYPIIIYHSFVCISLTRDLPSLFFVTIQQYLLLSVCAQSCSPCRKRIIVAMGSDNQQNGHYFIG